MRKTISLLPLCLLFVACGDDVISVSKPSLAHVEHFGSQGHWSIESRLPLGAIAGDSLKHLSDELSAISDLRIDRKFQVRFAKQNPVKNETSDIRDRAPSKDFRDETRVSLRDKSINEWIAGFYGERINQTFMGRLKRLPKMLNTSRLLGEMTTVATSKEGTFRAVETYDALEVVLEDRSFVLEIEPIVREMEWVQGEDNEFLLQQSETSIELNQVVYELVSLIAEQSAKQPIERATELLFECDALYDQARLRFLSTCEQQNPDTEKSKECVALDNAHAIATEVRSVCETKLESVLDALQSLKSGSNRLEANVSLHGHGTVSIDDVSAQGRWQGSVDGLPFAGSFKMTREF